MDGQATRWRHKNELGEERIGGWGSFELPMDANRRDNIAYFVYGAEAGLQASVISSDASSSRFLQLAAGSFATETVQLAGLIGPTEATRLGEKHAAVRQGRCRGQVSGEDQSIC